MPPTACSPPHVLYRVGASINANHIVAAGSPVASSGEDTPARCAQFGSVMGGHTYGPNPAKPRLVMYGVGHLHNRRRVYLAAHPPAEFSPLGPATKHAAQVLQYGQRVGLERPHHDQQRDRVYGMIVCPRCLGRGPGFPVLAPLRVAVLDAQYTPVRPFLGPVSLLWFALPAYSVPHTAVLNASGCQCPIHTKCLDCSKRTLTACVVATNPKGTSGVWPDAITTHAAQAPLAAACPRSWIVDLSVESHTG